MLWVIKCNFSLTVCAEGSSQHLNALVSDRVSGREVRGQWTPSRAEAGRHGAGRGGGSFRGFSFALSGEKDTEQRV